MTEHYCGDTFPDGTPKDSVCANFTGAHCVDCGCDDRRTELVGMMIDMGGLL